MNRARAVVVAVACGLIAGAMMGCRSVRSDEALVMLDVSTGAGMPPFTTARFSVAGRPEIEPHEVRYDGSAPLKFGYYLPGPNGTLRITGQALSASCVVPVGAGSAEVTVQLGQVSAPVPLVLAPLTGIDPSCLASRDAGHDGAQVHDAGKDASHDAGKDASRDATSSDGSHVRPDAGVDARVVRDAAPDLPPPPPPPPPCMIATQACPGAAACCSGLVCGTTSIGQVCCGNYNMTCSRPGGEDCCGQLECVNQHCCLPATYACSNSSCCPGLVCGTTSLGHVCCGNAGAACTRSDGCCGQLNCVSSKCQ